MDQNPFKQTMGKPARLFARTLADQEGLLAFAADRCRQVLNWDQKHLSNAKFEVATKNSTVTFELDATGEVVHARWWMKSLWDADGTIMNEDDLFSPTDVIGWLSMVKTDMINAGVKRLIALFQGRNIFPEGDKAAVRAFTESAQVFSDFMFGPEEVTDIIAKALEPTYRPLWRVKDNAWVLPLDGIQNGAIVARIDGNRTKWRIKVPFKDFTIDFRGHFDTREHALGALHKDMPDILLRKMVESIIVGHLSPKVPTQALPPEWADARKQVTDGWTT